MPVHDLSKVQVLLVDDEADSREVFREVLRGSGATVVTASSMHEALSHLNGWSPDVVISDIAMPDGDGYDLIRAIRAREGNGRSTPAIAVTAYGRDEDRRRALTAGFQKHLTKPIEPSLLLHMVSELARAGEG